MEVGSGGLLDSTARQPILTEHDYWTGSCGPTWWHLESIAEQKAGIIKQGNSISDRSYCSEALAVINPIAEAKNAPRLAYGSDYQVSHQESVVTERSFDYTSAVRQGRFHCGLIGLHQIENAGMALALQTLIARRLGGSWQVMPWLLKLWKKPDGQALGGLV